MKVMPARYPSLWIVSHLDRARRDDKHRCDVANADDHRVEVSCIRTYFVIDDFRRAVFRRTPLALRMRVRSSCMARRRLEGRLVSSKSFCGVPMRHRPPQAVQKHGVIIRASGIPPAGEVARKPTHILARKRVLMSCLDLRGLSDRELLLRLGRLVHDERRRLVDILRHLNEVERRGLYLRRAYGSLFEYCTQSLRYSESATCRRITAARCLRRFPEVADLLETGELNLVTVSLVAKILTEKNRRALLASVRGKSRCEVEAVVSAHSPQPPVRDRVRAVTVRVPVPAATSTLPGALADPAATDRQAVRNVDPASLAPTGKFSTATGGGKHSATEASEQDPRSSSEGAPRTQLTHQHKFEFAACDGFMKTFERMRALLASHARVQPSFEEVFLAGMDAWLDKHDPERRHERREARHKSSAGGRPTDGPRSKRRQSANPRSRHIPAAVRDAVHAKHDHRCSYVSPSGRRCGATRHLQVDHVTPFARGGGHEPGNLRLLCGKHNRLEAERVLGRDVMARHRRE